MTMTNENLKPIGPFMMTSQGIFCYRNESEIRKFTKLTVDRHNRIKSSRPPPILPPKENLHQHARVYAYDIKK